MNTSLLDQAIWLALSVGIAILAGIFRAYLEQQHQRKPLPEYVWYVVGTGHPWLPDALRLLYATGIPAAALFAQGALTYRSLGLKPFPWLSSLADGQMLLVAWQRDVEFTLSVILICSTIFYFGLRSVGEVKKSRPGLTAAAISGFYESLIEQVHWAFYRGICISIWGISRGSWIASLPVALELGLNPATWSRIKHQSTFASLIVNCGIFIASTVLFLQTQNLWLMLCADFVFRMLFAGLFYTSKRF